MGSHKGTRSEFDWAREDCDIWVFNEAPKNDWCVRADAVFQMHIPEVWRSPNNRNDANHYEWLKSGDTPTIYMMDKYDDVPKAIKYPLDEVREMVGNFNEDYYTSSVAYAIALGIYKKYKRIEIYGVEMETQTEYYFQRGGVCFWTGIAVGRGIEIDSHMEIFRHEPMYGYEGNINVPVSYHERRISEQDKGIREAEEQFNDFRKEVDTAIAEFIVGLKDPAGVRNKVMNMSTLASQFGMHVGITKEHQRYIKKIEENEAAAGGSLIVRQEYEQMMNVYNKAHAEKAASVQALAGQMQQIFAEAVDELNTVRRRTKMTKFTLIMNKFVDTSNQVGVFHGCRTENQKLLVEHDKMVRALGGSQSADILAGDNGSEPDGVLEVEEQHTEPLVDHDLAIQFGEGAQ
jgi:hypothetical protein